MDEFDPDCYSCLSNHGKYPGTVDGRISPAPPIFEGDYWLVEHVSPTSILGWNVVVAKRHIVSLHELSNIEYNEYINIIRTINSTLARELQCERVYNVTYAEIEHFNHLHTHVIPISKDFPKEHRGGKIFAYNRDSANHKPLEEIVNFAQYLRQKILEG